MALGGITFMAASTLGAPLMTRTATFLCLAIAAAHTSAREHPQVECPSGCCPQAELESQLGTAAEQPDCDALSRELVWNYQYYQGCKPDPATALWRRARVCYTTKTRRELERRYASLADPGLVEAEKRLQALFDQAAETVCAPYRQICDRDEGAYIDCLDWADTWRTRQLEAAARKALTFTAGAPTKTATKAWDGFATGLCRLPAEAWSGGRRPAGCEARVKASLEQKVKDTDRNFGC